MNTIKNWLLVLIIILITNMDPKLSFIQRVLAAGKQAITSKPIVYKREEPATPKDRYINNATSTGEFTMYNPSKAQTDSRPHEMASGKTIYDGAIAAGDRNIPFGTKVFVPQLNRTFIVEDRMNKRYDSATSTYFDIPTATGTGADMANAKKFGRQKLDFVIVGHDGRDRWGTASTTPSYNPLSPDPRAVVPVVD